MFLACRSHAPVGEQDDRPGCKPYDAIMVMGLLFLSSGANKFWGGVVGWIVQE
jgi:hypothetical protein